MRRIFPFDSLGSADLYVDAVYRGGTAGNAGSDPINALLPVGVSGGFRPRGSITKGIVSYCVLYSSLSEPDWPDSLQPELGRFVYFGDNKRPGHELHDTPKKGNVLLRDSFSSLHADDRGRIPPFLVFTKLGTGRDVAFRGLAVPGATGMSSSEDLVAIWRSRAGERFQNYRAVFAILDTSTVSRSWLESLQEGSPTGAPEAWLEWLATGRRRALVAESVREHRTPQEQIPQNPQDLTLLRHIHEYFGKHPEGAYAFEKCAAELVRLMDSNVVTLDLTRPWRDGGRDGIGTYHIGTDLSSLVVDFALEAKCYKPSTRNRSGVRETSRLVSRLRHRQFGIFITTSCLDSQAYQELVEDRHPVLVVAGVDIVEILRSAGLDTPDALDRWLRQIAPA